MNINGQSSPLRVLIVEDSPDTADSLALLLELAGHQARTARDSRSAVAAVGAWQPDVLLVDLGLPGEDGYAVARRLRDLLARKPLLVAITGYGREADRRRSQEEGFDFHLTKPADPEFLLRLLRAYGGRLGKSLGEDASPSV
jgi:CheY-like chemotaxis protein